MPNFLDYKEENAYLRGRIDELSMQLDKANEELRELRGKIGMLVSYNEALGQESSKLQRRRRTHTDLESDRPTKRRAIQSTRHSSDEESGEDNETARVRLKFGNNLTF